jgi:uncharacterized protein (TIGR03663 family)
MSVSALPERLRAHPVPVALLCLAAIAVGVRLYALGARVFYYDEVWFGYWVIQTIEHGDWTYRPILHGPFYARVNGIVFQLLGANDWTARLVPALMGGLLPLSAWLFRKRLDRAEVLALGVILAANPILLYYSRFMRKDLPLAALMLLTLGFLVRAADTGRLRYAYAAAFSLGWAFATKESVLLWLLAWAGGAVLVLDRRLLRARDTAGGPRDVIARGWTRLGRSVSHWNVHLGGTALLALAVVVYAYAPRAGETRSVGLWQALGGEFGQLPTVLDAATAGALHKALSYWISGGIQGHPYLPYFQDTVRTLLAGALGICLLAAVGFLWDRYGGERPRDLVGFNTYVGGAAIVGYPLANNLPVPWSTIHAVVPLAIPAAVGAVAVLRWAGVGTDQPADLGSRGPDRRRVARLVVAVVLLGALFANAVAVGIQTSYVAPHESPIEDGGSEIVYYAQPPATLREPIRQIYRVAADGGDDTDVLYVGRPLTSPYAPADTLPADASWHLHRPLVLGRIPLPWYTATAGADVADVDGAAAIGEDPPPIVVTTPARRDGVAHALGPAYTGTLYWLDGRGDRKIVVFVREA